MFYAHSTDRPDKSDWQPLEEHLCSVSALAARFTGKIGMEKWGEAAGLLHDLGKYSQKFQNYIFSSGGALKPGDPEYIDPKASKGKIDHATAGAQFYWDALKRGGGVSQAAGQILAICIASHHGGLIDCISPNGIDVFLKRMEKESDKTGIVEVIKKLAEPLNNEVNILISSKQIEEELLQRLKHISKFETSIIARNFMLALLVRFLFSTLIDADRLDSAGRQPKNKPEWKLLIENLENRLKKFEPRNGVDEIRQEISLACKNFATRGKGVYQLSVPTGGGKTLSSLRFALHHADFHDMDRIIHVVPYTSIIDQNADVARSTFDSIEKNGVQIVLEHHSNLTPEEDTEQNRTLSENWDAPIIFTTAVQFLETLFSGGTRGVRRMHQLANAVVIFDEVQTIPIRTVHMFNNAVNFLVEQCGATVVFCTATQPLLEKVDKTKGAARLSKYPEMISERTGLLRKFPSRVTIENGCKHGKWESNEIAETALEMLHETGSVLIVVNMKKQASELFQLLSERGENVFHLSTGMCPAHRKCVIEKIKKFLSSEIPVICVSTQLIEAGVDVDFGAVIRYLAGLDSIAQAAGRCNRDGRRTKGKVLIVNPVDENLDRLPEIRVAKEVAERVLHEYKQNPEEFDHDLNGPSAMRRYYQYYFFNRKHEMSFPLEAKEIGFKTDILSLLSTNAGSIENFQRENKKKNPSTHLHQAFMTAAKAFKAIDSPTQGVIVTYGEGRIIISQLCSDPPLNEKYRLLREAQRYSVNLFPKDFEKLHDVLYEVWEDSGIFYLDERHYSEQFGVSIEKTGKMTHLDF